MGVSVTEGAPKRFLLSSMRQREAPTSLRPGVECVTAEATRQRVVHTLCGGAGWPRSSSAGTPLFSAASDRRRPAVRSAARVSPSTAAMCFVGEGGDVTIDVSPHLLRRQMTLIASWTFSNVIQAECAEFCVERKVDVDKLFTHRWSLDQADEAYKLFDKQADGKGVFLM